MTRLRLHYPLVTIDPAGLDATPFMANPKIRRKGGADLRELGAHRIHRDGRVDATLRDLPADVVLEPELVIEEDEARGSRRFITRARLVGVCVELGPTP